MAFLSRSSITEVVTKLCEFVIIVIESLVIYNKESNYMKWGGRLLINRINVNAVLNPLGEGISRPSLILGDDFNRYVLKTQKVFEDNKMVTYDCMFLNELLAYQIACYLGVPIPEVAIAYLSGKLIEKDPALTFVHRFYEGNLFASMELKDTENNMVENYREMIQMKKPYITRSWNTFFSNITNVDDISKILAFDLLIANFDRYGNTGNLLVSNHSSSRRIYAIDHGHAFFGPKWGIEKVNVMRSVENTYQYIDGYINIAFGNNVNQGLLDGLGPVFNSLEDKIDLTNVVEHSFKNVVNLIEDISEPLLDEWFKEIPDEWFVKGQKSQQIAFHKQFILNQKNLVRFIIQRMAERNAFSNYLGGELQWRKEKNVGIV